MYFGKERKRLRNVVITPIPGPLEQSLLHLRPSLVPRSVCAVFRDIGKMAQTDLEPGEQRPNICVFKLYRWPLFWGG